MQASFSVTEQDSRAFAALSGDFNPLHVDPVVARRLLFGGCVLHGLHVCLLALDKAVGNRQPGGSLAELRAQFMRPVRAGERIEVVAQSGAGDRERYAVRRNGEAVQTLTLRFASTATATTDPPDKMVEPGPCRRLTISDIEQASGNVALSVDRRSLASLFPNLAARLPLSQIAALLATTRVVGMGCPGLNSVFTGFKMSFDAPPGRQERELTYRVRDVDRRFSLVSIAVMAPGAAGDLQALVRPEPVAQPQFGDVRAVVAPGEFSGQRALVIGGSRGLGELAAKIVAAGGGEVRISYHSGRDDSEAVAADIRAGGGVCQTLPFDVLAPDHTTLAERLSGWRPTHLLYFATPRIELIDQSEWRPDRFQRFCDYYLAGFQRTVAALLALAPAAPLGVFYPSTIFLDRPEPGAQEYVAAKAAGEALCRYLEFQHRPRLRCDYPRLPRLDTDQTASVFQAEQKLPALAVVLDAWRNASRPRRA